jgi:hypothetical protein
MKKEFLRGLWLATIIAILGWASTAMCSPISFTFSEYHVWSGWAPYEKEPYWEEDLKSPVPPVMASKGQGSANVKSASNFAAESSTIGRARLETTLRFIATFPSISIGYDYDYASSEHARSGDYASSSVDIQARLNDLTTGDDIWSEGYGANGTGKGSASISETLNLTSEHEYELFFSIFSKTTTSYSVTSYAISSGEISNLQIEAVPIPSTLLLLCSGILGLSGMRMFRKGR